MPALVITGGTVALHFYKSAGSPGSSGGVVLVNGGLLGCADLVGEIHCPVLPEPPRGVVKVDNEDIGRPM